MSPKNSVRRVALAVLACLALAGTARAQGDGPHNLPIIPKDTNLFVVLPLGLSGNFNPSQTVLIPNANVDVFAVPLTYVRTFSLGGRFGRLFLTAPLSSLDASGTVIDPRTGQELTVSRGRSGWMDPMVTMHIGLVGAPALGLPEFMKHPKSFQMLAIVGTAIPIGTYDSTRAINLGTNRWTFRLGLGLVTPLTKTTAWESANSVMLFTDNNDVFGRVATRSQDPLFVSENHLTHAFNPKWWGSIDLRWQIGGETHSDGVTDDNRTNILGGGVTLGHTFNRHFSGYIGYGNVLASSGNADEWMVRTQLVYSF
jgi:Putative MetA-pathway of phenol degradation